MNPEPAASAPTRLEYEFGPFRLDVARRALYREGEFIPLTPKAAEILLLLLEEATRVVTKEKILDAAFDGAGPIATVARRGYRFTADVCKGGGESAQAASPAKAVAAQSPA